MRTHCIEKKLCKAFDKNTSINITEIIDAIGRGDITEEYAKAALLSAIHSDIENDYINIIKAYHRPRKTRELKAETKQKNAQKKIQAIKEQYNLTDDIIAEMLNKYKDGNRE